MQYECGSCQATGLYRGFAEPLGVAVVCLACDGSGFVDATNRTKTTSSKSFSGLRHRQDVNTVCRSRGSFVAFGVGPTGGGISYQEFLDGIRPN